MPQVRFGNVSGHYGEPIEVPEDATHAELVALAEKHGVMLTISSVDPTPAPDDLIAARIGGCVTFKPISGKAVTVFSIPNGRTPSESLREVEHAWPFHSNAPPAWVSTPDALLEGLFAQTFGCPTGEPENWILGSNVNGANDAHE